LIGIPVGLMMAGFFGAMVIPAAWMAAGGDMPAGHGNPSDMQIGRTILFILIAMAAAGAVLVASALVVGIGLLLTRQKGGRAGRRGLPLS
jgi:hypothetical protein